MEDRTVRLTGSEDGEAMRSSFEEGQLKLKCRKRFTDHWGSLWAVGLLVIVTLMAGCHGDPNVRKQKYVESGKR